MQLFTSSVGAKWNPIILEDMITSNTTHNLSLSFDSVFVVCYTFHLPEIFDSRVMLVVTKSSNIVLRESNSKSSFDDSITKTPMLQGNLKYYVLQRKCFFVSPNSTGQVNKQNWHLTSGVILKFSPTV